MPQLFTVPSTEDLQAYMRASQRRMEDAYRLHQIRMASRAFDFYYAREAVLANEELEYDPSLTEGELFAFFADTYLNSVH